MTVPRPPVRAQAKGQHVEDGAVGDPGAAPLFRFGLLSDVQHAGTAVVRENTSPRDWNTLFTVRRQRARPAPPALHCPAAALRALAPHAALTSWPRADINDGFSFHGVPRFYREALRGLERAVDHWLDERVDFAVHLGDVSGFAVHLGDTSGLCSAPGRSECHAFPDHIHPSKAAAAAVAGEAWTAWQQQSGRGRGAAPAFSLG